MRKANLFVVARRMVEDTPVVERPSLDEWFEFEGQDVNVVGADYSADAPRNGALIVIYPGLVPDHGMMPRPVGVYAVGI